MGRTAAKGVDGFLYADRGIYRPGETLHLMALLRDRLAHSVKERRGAIVIRRPSGLEFSRNHFTATPVGAVDLDTVRSELLRTVEVAVEPAAISLWIRSPTQ